MALSIIFWITTMKKGDIKRKRRKLFKGEKQKQFSSKRIRLLFDKV